MTTLSDWLEGVRPDRIKVYERWKERDAAS